MENIGYKMILASNSPRRKELLAGLGYPFEVRVMEGIDESYPASLPASEVAREGCSLSYDYPPRRIDYYSRYRRDCGG